jgi:hypothetical protein
MRLCCSRRIAFCSSACLPISEGILTKNIMNGAASNLPLRYHSPSQGNLGIGNDRVCPPYRSRTTGLLSSCMPGWFQGTSPATLPHNSERFHGQFALSVDLFSYFFCRFFNWFICSFIHFFIDFRS